MALDTDHIACELGKHRGLITGSGADLEHMVVGSDLEELGHAGHDEGLRDRLALRDAEGVVTVRDVLILFAHESLARDSGHRRDDALVPDAHTHEVQDHLGTLAFVLHDAE